MSAWQDILQMAAALLPGHIGYLYFAVSARLAYCGYVGIALLRAKQRTANENTTIYPRFKKWTKKIMLLDALGLFLVSIEFSNELVSTPPTFIFIIGLLLCIVGIGTKVAARNVIGEPGYYWKDFFAPPEEKHLVIHSGGRGIYRYLDNPMYTVGNLHQFGWALMCFSGIGILMATFSVLVLQAFYLVVERPHVQSIRG